MEYVHAQEVYEVGQWLWHTWQSGRFQLTENQGLNPAIRNFYWTHLLYLSRKNCEAMETTINFYYEIISLLSEQFLVSFVIKNLVI